jgi:hypothetical protein
VELRVQLMTQDHETPSHSPDVVFFLESGVEAVTDALHPVFPGPLCSGHVGEAPAEGVLEMEHVGHDVVDHIACREAPFPVPLSVLKSSTIRLARFVDGPSRTLCDTLQQGVDEKVVPDNAAAAFRSGRIRM